MEYKYDLIPLEGRTYYMSGFTNVGLYDLGGGEVCLIDTGNCEEAAEAMLGHLERHGWRVRSVLNTHSHADHIYGNALLQEKTGCPCYCAGMEQFFAGHTGLEPQFIFGAEPFDALETKVYLAPQAKSEPLTEDVLPEGFSLTFLRGHSPDQVGIRTPDNVWFIGDAVVSTYELEHYRLTYLCFLEQYLDTLEKIKTLPGDVFVPSHAEPQRDIAPLAEANRRQVEANCELILELCREPLTQEQLQAAAFRVWGRKMSVPQYVLTGSILRTYFAYLHRKGKLDYLVDGMSVKWRTVR